MTKQDIGNDILYDHRNHLFIALMRSNPGLSWRAKNHSDGTMHPHWFIAGMGLPTGAITYHLPLRMWKMLDNCGMVTVNNAPEGDRHTPDDVIKRLENWFEQ